MKVLVTGDRNWSDVKFLYKCLDKLRTRISVDVIIEGDAQGVDRLSGYWAKANLIDNVKEKAHWDISGKAAGPIRNQRMIDLHQPNMCVAFHDDLENSRGTKDMVKRCLKHRIPVCLFSHKYPNGVEIKQI